MIKIGERTFVPLKIAAARIGYSVDWIHKCSPKYRFPKRVYLTLRNSGYWLDELDSWLKRRARKRQVNRAA